MTPPSTATTIAAIRDWLARCGQTNAALAQQAGVDEKSIRQARQQGWNPRAETLGKIEALVPPDWQVDPTAEPPVDDATAIDEALAGVGAAPGAPGADPAEPACPAAIARIRAWRRANDWTAHRYAAEASVPEGSTRRMDDDGWSPTLRTLRKLDAVVPAGWQPGDATPAHPDAPAASAAAGSEDRP